MCVFDFLKVPKWNRRPPGLISWQEVEKSVVHKTSQACNVSRQDEVLGACVRARAQVHHI